MAFDRFFSIGQKLLLNDTAREITLARKDKDSVWNNQLRYARHIFKVVAGQSRCGKGDSLQKIYTRGALLLHPDKLGQRKLHRVWSRVVEQSFHYFTAAFEILKDDELEHASDDDGAGSLSGFASAWRIRSLSPDPCGVLEKTKEWIQWRLDQHNRIQTGIPVIPGTSPLRSES